MIERNEYISRRNLLLESMSEDSAALIHSGSSILISSGVEYPFEVKRDFYYLTGIDQKDSFLFLIKSGGETKEFLFLPPFDPAKTKWYGLRLTLEEGNRISGIKNVLQSGALTSRVDSVLGSLDFTIRTLYLDYDRSSLSGKQEFDVQAAQLRKLYPSIAITSCYGLIQNLRFRKSKTELEEMSGALEFAKLGLRSALSIVKPGVYEAELANQYRYVTNTSSSFQGLPFEPVFASGKAALYGEYPKMIGTCKKDELLTLSVGARNHFYCVELARTIPVSGAFNETQAKVYDIVSECLAALKKFLKPGRTFADLKTFAEEFLGSECYAHGLLPTKEEIVRYFYRPIAHFIGLDRFDPVGDDETPLHFGSTIVLTPSLCFPQWDFAITLSDTVLLGEKGGEALGEDPFSSKEEIEAFFARR